MNNFINYLKKVAEDYNEDDEKQEKDKQNPEDSNESSNKDKNKKNDKQDTQQEGVSAESCYLGQPGLGQALNQAAGLPGRGLGRQTGVGRRRAILATIAAQQTK